MRIIRAKDYKDMSRKAANIISAQVILKPDSVLGLAPTSRTFMYTESFTLGGVSNGFEPTELPPNPGFSELPFEIL